MIKETLEQIYWSPRSILAGLIAFFGIQLITDVLANGVIGNQPTDILIGAFLFHAGILSLPFMLAHNKNHIRLFHLDRKRLPKEILFALKSAIAAVLAVAILMILITVLFGLVQYPSWVDYQLANNPPSRLEELLFILLAVIIAPITEEVFFRGFIYNAIKKQWGILSAVLIQGALFSVGHGGDLFSIIHPMLLSFAFVGLYEYRKTIWTPIFVHCISNIPGAVLMLIG